ncbi:MAG TPA: DUF1287 domain-containing protein [Holophagaceae bacterium]|nr:DUF1287 domain-containing protein [Holophagaceae bacterium]
MNPFPKSLRLASALLLGWALQAQGPATRLVAAARSQVGITLRYDHQYQRLKYPGGDVPLDRGVCTDVVIRAYRGLGLDLQVLVHRDMVAAWAEYPKDWGLKGPDANIDHRRVPNLATFLHRHGETLPIPRDPAAYRPGDIVVWRLPSGVPHIGIVSDRRTPEGVPLMIHNVGYGTQEEDELFRNPITGHYRWFPAPPPGVDSKG